MGEDEGQIKDGVSADKSTTKSVQEDEGQSEDKASKYLPMRFRKAVAIAGIIATAATIVATLAGIFFSLLKMQSDQAQFQLLQSKELTAQKQSTENTAAANLERAKVEEHQTVLQSQSALRQIEAEDRKARLEVDQKTQDRQVSERDQLAIAIRHFESTEAGSENEIAIIAGYLVRNDILKSSAIEALAARLDMPRTPSEARSILRVLPLAGREALDVVVAANRKAYSEMMHRVQAELVWRACQPTSNLMIDDSSVGQELVHNRALSFQARVALDKYPTSVAWFTGVFEPGQLPKRQEAGARLSS
jgi:hypothetical protein